MATTFRFDPAGPFDLLASIRFIEGFEPAPQRAGEEGVLDLVLRTDDWGAAAVRVHQSPERVVGEVVATEGEVDEERLRAQVARVLSLDVDGAGFADVLAADDVLGGIAALFAGLRPVLFPTPYEAACWSVLSQRTRMTQAAVVRDRLAQAHGTPVEVGQTTRSAFPAPATLLEVTELEGASAQKLTRLHAVAEAALDGALDGSALRGQEIDAALAGLQEIHGLGPFAAELVLVRGAGAPDVFPSSERRFHQAMAELYDEDPEDVEALRAIADGWRPYRSWGALLLRAWWEQRNH